MKTFLYILAAVCSMCFAPLGLLILWIADQY